MTTQFKQRRFLGTPHVLRNKSWPAFKHIMPVFQNIPTLGAVAITMALHNCDEVAVAGFGYNMSTPHAPLHYYEKIRMAAIKEVIGGVSVTVLKCPSFVLFLNQSSLSISPQHYPASVPKWRILSFLAEQAPGLFLALWPKNGIPMIKSVTALEICLFGLFLSE